MQKPFAQLDSLLPHQWPHANAKGNKSLLIAELTRLLLVAAMLEEKKPTRHMTGQDCNSSLWGESKRQRLVLED
jgi:hypothetical protein